MTELNDLNRCAVTTEYVAAVSFPGWPGAAGPSRSRRVIEESIGTRSARRAGGNEILALIERSVRVTAIRGADSAQVLHSPAFRSRSH